MFWLFGLGVLMSISPIVAHAYGAGRDEEVGRRFRQAIWLALMLVGSAGCRARLREAASPMVRD